MCEAVGGTDPPVGPQTKAAEQATSSRLTSFRQVWTGSVVHDGGGGVDADGIENEEGGGSGEHHLHQSVICLEMNRYIESWNSDIR